MKVPKLEDCVYVWPEIIGFCRQNGFKSGDEIDPKEEMTWVNRKIDEFKEITGKYPEKDRLLYENWICGSEQLTLFEGSKSDE
ncbi:hypothetical protein [Sporolactobacillus terrae]|uniref:Uncharacterized protein n=1 Tax=Sporolactobacillus terrae TaxID=269673 RepID=A0A5K7WSL8_9BACL|nr:hypothetical protein [Sporolactobacillus terrae]BBN97475.1 hypothetical protein St703_01800 [Sporolactobacillus terrae]